MISSQRMNQESKNMLKASNAGVRVPQIYKVDKEEKKIFMEYLEGYVTLKAHLGGITSDLEEQLTNLSDILFKLGMFIAKLHNENIIHGDLTSSNILICPGTEEQVCIIDFGLSFISDNIEHKAVDLNVLEKSFLCEQNGSKFAEEMIKVFLIGYKKFCPKQKEILRRLEEV